ncbi:MAG: cache domain-containing protein [Rhodoglobus sp.]
MTKTLDAATHDCVTAVAHTFSTVFEQVEAWRDAIERRVADSDGVVTVAEVDRLVEKLVVPGLGAEDALIIGAGFVASPGFIADSEFHLAWWLGHANTFGVGSASPALRRLEAEEDPASESFRDYTTLEWWRVPTSTGQPHITGPYVDYLCTDDYTLTLTMPVTHAGEIVGIAGADLYVVDIERTLLPHVRAIGGTATVINASGRVVVSTDQHRPTGSILRTDATEDPIPCGDTSLLLVLG